MPQPLPIAVLISGGGTTLRNLIERMQRGTLHADIRLVISSNPASAGLRFASEANIPALVVEKSKTASASEYSAAIFEPCRAAGATHVVMGGFLKHVLIPPDFENRVVNIHPSLIPQFCGRGMYGLKVHEAALAAGVPETGCTVHFVDNEYDHGPVISQKRVPVLPGDTPETLQQRVFLAERKALPEALNLLAAGAVRVEGGRVTIQPQGPATAIQ